MSNVVEFAVASYHKTHRLFLSLVDDLTDEQLTFQANRITPPVAFHLWHLARYADSIQDQIGLEGGMIWQAESLAAQWGFSEESLGIYESGTGMDTQLAGQLAWPGKDVLTDYCRRAFEAADEAVGMLDDEMLLNAATWGGSVGSALLMNLEHDNRHLGIVECMRGVLGLPGSATE